MASLFSCCATAHQCVNRQYIIYYYEETYEDTQEDTQDKCNVIAQLTCEVQAQILKQRHEKCRDTKTQRDLRGNKGSEMSRCNGTVERRSYRRGETNEEPLRYLPKDIHRKRRLDTLLVTDGLTCSKSYWILNFSIKKRAWELSCKARDRELIAEKSLPMELNTCHE